MQKLVTFFIASIMLSACSSAFFEKDTELRSPCVAIDPELVTSSDNNSHGQHPCARRPVNAHWIG